MTWVLYEGDCLEIMPLLPDKSIDMILCDLPYGTTACKWDTVIPFKPLWEQYERVIKDNGAIVLFGTQPFTSALVMSNPKLFKHEWIWQKNRGSNFATLKYNPMKEHESILVFGKKIKYYPIKEERKGSGLQRVKYEFNPSNTGKRETYNNMELSKEKTNKKQEELRFPSSVQKFNVEVGLHPTQKPVALFEYLIKTYTQQPGDLILDNCAGSGTTGVAAENLGRNSILIEKDPKYCEIIRKRMANRQMTLFERGADL
jgi:site-specific DNA-methyltransferase (adenine-specific)